MIIPLNTLCLVPELMDDSYLMKLKNSELLKMFCEGSASLMKALGA
jgi:hypothetical protein